MEEPRWDTLYHGWPKGTCWYVQSWHIHANLNIILASLGGTPRGRTSGDFPWKSLPKKLARLGYVLINYPDEISMPGELWPTISCSKGIHDLTQQHRTSLINCLKAGTLTIRAVTNDAAHLRLTTSNDPVIIGEAPSTSSMYSCGRRAFADGRIDQKGLSHLQWSPSPVPQLPSSSVSRCRTQVIMEITQLPPHLASITRPPPRPASWRVHKCSTVRTEHLIPSIASIKGGSSTTESNSEDASTDDCENEEPRVSRSGRRPVKCLRCWLNTSILRSIVDRTCMSLNTFCAYTSNLNLISRCLRVRVSASSLTSSLWSLVMNLLLYRSLSGASQRPGYSTGHLYTLHCWTSITFCTFVFAFILSIVLTYLARMKLMMACRIRDPAPTKSSISMRPHPFFSATFRIPNYPPSIFYNPFQG